MKFDTENISPIQAILIFLMLVGVAVGMGQCSSGGGSGISGVSSSSAASLERKISAVNADLISDVEPGVAGSVTVKLGGSGIREETAIAIWRIWAGTTDSEVAQVYFRSRSGRKLGHVRGVKGDPTPTVKLR